MKSSNKIMEMEKIKAPEYGKKNKVLQRTELKDFSLAQLVFKKEELFENVESDSENKLLWNTLFNVLDELHARQWSQYYENVTDLHIQSIA